MANLAQFDIGSAARIARVVRQVEDQPSRAKPLQFEAPQFSLRHRAFRLGTYAGSWDVGESKTVTFSNVTATPNTVNATNFTLQLPAVGTATAFSCGIAREGTSWYLVSALQHNVKRATFTASWNKNAAKMVTFVSGGTVTAVNRHATVTVGQTATATARSCTVARDGMGWELIAAEC